MHVNNNNSKHFCRRHRVLQKAQGAAGSTLQIMREVRQFMIQVMLHECGQLMLPGSSMLGCIMCVHGRLSWLQAWHAACTVPCRVSRCCSAQ